MKSVTFTALALALVGFSAQAQEFTVSANIGRASVQGTEKGMGFRLSGATPLAPGAPVATESVETVNFKNGAQTPVGLNLGMKFGENTFVLEFMNTTKNNTQTELGPNLVYGTLIGPSGNADRIDGFNNMKAQVVDFKWIRPLGTVASTTFSYELGLRYGSWTANTTEVIDPLPNGSYLGQFSNKAKTEAYGLTMGLNAKYNFNKTLSLCAGVNFAMLQGYVRGDFYYGDGVGGEEFTNKGKNRSFQQMDYHLRLNMAFTKMIGAYLGYEMRDFGKVTADSQTPMMAIFGAEPNRGWGSLNGFNAGVSFTF